MSQKMSNKKPKLLAQQMIETGERRTDCETFVRLFKVVALKYGELIIPWDRISLDELSGKAESLYNEWIGWDAINVEGELAKELLHVMRVIRNLKRGDGSITLFKRERVDIQWNSAEIVQCYQKISENCVSRHHSESVKRKRRVEQRMRELIVQEDALEARETEVSRRDSKLDDDENDLDERIALLDTADSRQEHREAVLRDRELELRKKERCLVRVQKVMDQQRDRLNELLEVLKNKDAELDKKEQALNRIQEKMLLALSNQ